jgi:hypothetical protein
MSQTTTYIAWFLPLRCCTVYSSVTFLATIIACSPTTIWRVKISWTPLIEKKHRMIYPTKHSSGYSILKINHISDQIYQLTSSFRRTMLSPIWSALASTDSWFSVVFIISSTSCSAAITTYRKRKTIKKNPRYPSQNVILIFDSFVFITFIDSKLKTPRNVNHKLIKNMS